MLRRPFARPRRAASQSADSRARRPLRERPGVESLEGRQLMSLATEFLVNRDSTIDNDQFQTDNASGANGDFVVVWTSQTTRSDFDVFAKAFDRFGNALTGEINVDETTFQASDPTVGMDANGNFIVAWVREVNGSDDNIVMRKYTRTGTEITTAPFNLASSPVDERSPSLAVANDGTFVVSYEKANKLASGKNDVNVMAQLRRSDLTLAKSITVAASNTASEQDPSVAIMPNKQFAVAYETRAGGKADIRLAQYNASGTPKKDMAITSTSDRSEVDPDLAMDVNGNAVVVYEEVFTPPGGDNTNFEVKARRVRSNGSLGSLVNIAPSAADDETNVVVAMHPTNLSFAVAYDFSPLSGGGDRLRAKEFSSTDAVLATFSDFFIGDKFAALSMDGDGDYLLTYQGENVGTTDIFARRGRLS